MRIKAQLLGIQAQDFTTEQVVSGGEQYAGRIRVYAPEEIFKEFRRKGGPVSAVYVCDENGNKVKPELYENEFVVLQGDQSTNKTQMGRVNKGVIKKLEFERSQPYGVKPRNAGQYFLQEALMQPADVAPLVIVKGMAGTAKTF